MPGCDDKLLECRTGRYLVFGHTANQNHQEKVQKEVVKRDVPFYSHSEGWKMVRSFLGITTFVVLVSAIHALSLESDINKDGIVNMHDLVVMSNDWLSVEPNVPGDSGMEIGNAVLVNPGDNLTARYNELKSPEWDEQMGPLSENHPRTLVLTPGKHLVSESTALESHTKVYAMPGTVIYVADAMNDSVFINSDPIGGNKDIGIYNITIEGNRANQTSGSGVYFDHADDVTLANVYVKNIDDNGICLENCDRFLIRDFRGLSADLADLQIISCSKGQILGGRCKDSKYSYLLTDCTQVIVDDCYAEGNTDEPLVLYHTESGCSYITISNSQFCDPNLSIEVKGMHAVGAQHISMVNCVFKNFGNCDKVIYIEDGTGVSHNWNISDCIFNNNKIATGSQNGLLIEDTTFITLTNVHANGNGPIGAGAGTGIYINRCENVSLFNCEACDNITQGVKILSTPAWGRTKNIRIMGGIFGNISGTDQNYGVWISPGQGVTNVSLYGATFSDNDVEDIYDPDGIAWIESTYFKAPLEKTADYTVSYGDVGRTLTNKGASEAITFTLPVTVVGTKYRFYVATAQPLHIDFYWTQTLNNSIGGDQLTAGEYIYSATVGSFIVLECFASGRWECTAIGGVWSEESP